MRIFPHASIMQYALLLGAACALAPISSMAETLPNSGHSISSVKSQDSNSMTVVGELDALHSKIALLKEQLAIAKLQHGIAEVKKNPDKGPQQSIYTGPSVPVPSTSPIIAEKTNLPHVLSIAGTGADLVATLALPADSGEISVHTGAKVTGGFIVRSITANGVEVVGKHGLKTLPFASGSNAMMSAEPSPMPIMEDGPAGVFPRQGVAPLQGAAPRQGGQ